MNITSKGNYKYDIQNENLDLYLADLLENMSDLQRNRIPEDLSGRLHKARKNGLWATSGLSFGQKAFLLSAVFGKTVTMVVGGNEGDTDMVAIPDFKKAIKAARGKASSLEYTEDLYTKGLFVIGDKELMETLSFSRLMCCTDIYKSVIPAARRKPVPPSKFEEHRRAFKGIVSLIMGYESNKKRLSTDFGISVPEWYTLLHFFDSEKKGPTLYNGRFKGSHGANRVTLKSALNRLSRDGYLSYRGKTQQRHYWVSAKGEQTIMNIFDKLILNQ